MRASGVRDVPIYCRDHRCSHHVEANADGWTDDVRLSDIEPSFTCTRCGKRGAEVRPPFSQASTGWVSAARQRGARKAVPYNFRKLVGLTFKSSRTI
jgi:hypothetical protein